VGLLTALCVLPCAAWAQDSDADGVSDAADAFPCDASAAAVSYVPAAGELGTLAFEDQWPGWSDLDFNDVVLRYHAQVHHDGAGLATAIHLRLAVAAAGGFYDNGLGWQLPVGRGAVSAVRRRVGAGPWEPLPLEVDATATVRLSNGLREVFGGAAGPVNVTPGGPQQPPALIEVEVTLAPSAVDAGLAPFDLFIFQGGRYDHQIHFPAYGGTAAMNAALFGTDRDGSSPSRKFVDKSGLPYALDLQSTAVFPLEGVAISSVFPEISVFAASGGGSAADFWLSPLTGPSLSSTGPSVTISDPAPDTSCVVVPPPQALLPKSVILLADVCPGAGSTRAPRRPDR
jgi:LruC domain-containing protein